MPLSSSLNSQASNIIHIQGGRILPRNANTLNIHNIVEMITLHLPNIYSIYSVRDVYYTNIEISEFIVELLWMVNKIHVLSLRL